MFNALSNCPVSGISYPVSSEKSLQLSKIPLFLQPRKGKNGAVAQLVEQWTENPCVGGSIPPHTTSSKRLPD